MRTAPWSILAIVTRPQRSGSTPVHSSRFPRISLALFAVAALGLSACSAGDEPLLVLFDATPTPVPAATAVPTPTPSEAPTPTTEAATATAAPEPDPDPTATTAPATEPTATPVPQGPMWKVIDNVIKLNMRERPTTSAPVVAELEPGTTGLEGSGQTADADGFTWLQILPDGDRPGGWVASNFVVPDDTVPVALPRDCFHTEEGSNATTVALQFSADAETFTGGIRLVTGTAVEYQAVAGRRVDGTVFTVNVQRLGVGQDRVEEWISGPAGISLGDSSAVAATTCDQVSDLVSSIDVNVTSFPAVPA